jgi:hypothetical protein
VDEFVYVKFIHESVKDFLLSMKGLQSLDTSLSQQLIGKSHSRLTDCCLSYIMMSSLGPLEEEDLPYRSWDDISKQHLFLDYVIDWLLHHVEKALVRGVSQLEILSRLQQGSQQVRRLQICANHVDNYAWGDEAEVIHAAAVEGQYQIVRALLDEMNVDVNTTGGEYGSALQAAVASGHEKIVQLCLDRGADVNAVGGCYGTTLQAAAGEGRYKIVRLCIDRGADVNRNGGICFSALHAAVSRGYESIARILLRHGANVNTQSGEWGTALYQAESSSYPSTSMIDLLLQYGAEYHPPIEEESEEGALS